MQKGVVRSNMDLNAAWLTLMLSAAGRDSALQGSTVDTRRQAIVGGQHIYSGSNLL
jgi:hypothetical protein